MADRPVGRDREIESLCGWIDESVESAVRIVLVGGDAGIGKTALVSATADRAAAQGTRVVWGRTTEAADAPPFRPWRQLLQTIGASELLDPTDPSDPSDPSTDRFARFDAIADALVREAHRQNGLVAILEDVHRADQPSLQLLEHIGEWVTEAPLCLLITHRGRFEDVTPPVTSTLAHLGRLPGCRRLHLGGLGTVHITRLLGDAVRQDDLDRLVASTGGNPLAATELARHLRSGGDPSQPPGSVVDAVRTRLASCSDECAGALRVAAVIGRDFSAGVVATALGAPARTTLGALDEAVRSGFVEPTGEPGWFRFLHILVRDGVEASLGARDLAQTNLDVARAIEAYEGANDDVATDLARHWRAAAALGHRGVAADHCERAAVAADRRMAWEDAARHYDQAVDLGGTEADPIDHHRRLLGAAAARLNCDDIGEAVDRCIRAADAVRGLGRGDLLAEAALLVEGRGGPPLARLRDLATEALGADDLEPAIRARLLGQLSVCAFYLEPDRMEALSASSLALAEECGDPTALVAAARARQMALSGPESAADRLALATVIGDAGRVLGRASVVQWESIWRIDALIELGRLPEALAEVNELRHRVDAVGLPIARWHLSRVEALTAQATGRFDDALDWAGRCCEQFGRLEDPVGALAMLAGFRTSVALHTGFDASLLAAWDEVPLDEAPPFLGDLPIVGPLTAVVGVGDLDRAARIYDRMAPVPAWNPPRFLWLHLFALRLWAATALGRVDDVALITDELSRHRGLHIGAGAGGLTYTGPVELWTGIGSAVLGRFDRAVEDLAAAGRVCSAIGARAFAVQAELELARVLVARDAPGDRGRAVAIVPGARTAAETMGMDPWIAACDAIGATLVPAQPGPLSPRELEVAALVSEGLTNRAIADRLYLSERTAQNHVQHILTKLALSNRAQIAAWYLTR